MRMSRAARISRTERITRNGRSKGNDYEQQVEDIAPDEGEPARGNEQASQVLRQECRSDTDVDRAKDGACYR